MKLNKMREEIANQFITALKEDKIPWRKDWSAVSDMPVNAITDNRYRGLNAFWLYMTAEDRGYKDPRWCTYMQASDKGWQVKKVKRVLRLNFGVCMTQRQRRN